MARTFMSACMQAQARALAHMQVCFGMALHSQSCVLQAIPRVMGLCNTEDCLAPAAHADGGEHQEEGNTGEVQSDEDGGASGASGEGGAASAVGEGAVGDAGEGAGATGGGAGVPTKDEGKTGEVQSDTDAGASGASAEGEEGNTGEVQSDEDGGAKSAVAPASKEDASGESGELVVKVSSFTPSGFYCGATGSTVSSCDECASKCYSPSSAALNRYFVMFVS